MRRGRTVDIIDSMPKTNLREFDYKKVARLDADMWRAYYNHQFFRLFLLLMRLIKTHLGFGWPLTLRLAYYSAWAATYYRIKRHSGINNARVLGNLVKFYGLISRNSVNAFDYTKVAELELAWWDIHRRSIQNNKRLEEALAKSAAATYNVPARMLAEYAHYRAEAMILPRHEGDKQAVPTDWEHVTRLLTKAWEALNSAVRHNSPV